MPVTDEAEAPEAPKTKRSAPPKLPSIPASLELPVAEWGVRLRQVSLGKPVSNVSATLTFDLDRPAEEIADLMGEHAYSAVFLGGFLGEGALIKEAPLKVDEENGVHQQLKIRIPRFLNETQDQILASIAPLVGGRKTIEPLFGMDWSWRLNITVDISGELQLYAMQQRFDLTTPVDDPDLIRGPVEDD